MKKPLPYLKLWFLLRKSPGWLWNSRELIKLSTKAYFRPQKFYKENYKPKVDKAIDKLKSDAYKGIPLAQITSVIDKDLDNISFNYCFSLLHINNLIKQH